MMKANKMVLKIFKLEIEACLLEFANTKPSKNKDHL
jgi:hypothetical protein